jgi:ATP-dependent Clp protease protease subunit
LEEASKNAKTTDDLRILNAVKMAGGEKALSIIKSAYVPKQRQPDGEQAKKRADDAITSDAILEKFNKVNHK